MANSVFVKPGVTVGPIYIPDGLATAPSLALASDPTLGFYSPGANLFALSIGGGLTHLFTSTSFRIRSDVGVLLLGASDDVGLVRVAAASARLSDGAAGYGTLAVAGINAGATAGVSASVTTATLVGKTLTFVNGICTGFA
jgi:hypothetical protein